MEHTSGKGKMKDGKFTAGDIYNLLYERYKDGREWLCAREVADGTGWATRRLDFVACDCYASKGWGIYAFEVKISKSDLRNELFDPTKHNIFFDNIGYYSIVAPDYVLNAEYVALIPKQWGIIKAVAGKTDGEPNKLLTYRKPLALHDEKSLKMSKDFVFCLMRRLRDDPSSKQTEQEMRNAEYQRGFDDGKRWCPKSDYEKLWRESNEKMIKYGKALQALGVHTYWCNSEDEIVQKAQERALEIKKCEALYDAVETLGFNIKGLQSNVDKLACGFEPLRKAKEEVGKLQDVEEAENTTG